MGDNVKKACPSIQWSLIGHFRHQRCSNAVIEVFLLKQLLLSANIFTNFCILCHYDIMALWRYDIYYGILAFTYYGIYILWHIQTKAFTKLMAFYYGILTLWHFTMAFTFFCMLKMWEFYNRIERADVKQEFAKVFPEIFERRLRLRLRPVAGRVLRRHRQENVPLRVRPGRWYSNAPIL